MVWPTVLHVHQVPCVPNVYPHITLRVQSLAQVNSNPAHNNKHIMYICDRTVVDTNIMYCIFILACTAPCLTCEGSATNCLTCVTTGNTLYLYEHPTDPTADDICVGKDDIIPVVVDRSCLIQSK